MKKILLAIIIFSFLTGFLLLPQLPSAVPMHWNIQGQIDGYMSKNLAVWFMPGLMFFMFLSFQFLPLLDPKKDNYKHFKKEWEIMQTILIVFFAYMHFIVLYSAFHAGLNIMPLMFVGLGILFIVFGMNMSKIRQNYFIGIKVPWTLADEDNWNKTHRYAGRTFMIAGAITLVEAYFIWFAPFIIFGCIILASVLPIIYSFLLYKKAISKMKFVYLFLFILVIAVLMLRLWGGEDDWICQKGRWVKHGQPSAPAPTKACYH
jgi:uncharacterized membrane protein